MNNKLLDILKQKNYILPSYLLKNYSKMGLNSDLLILIIYLMSLNNPIVCDYEKISNEMNFDKELILNSVNDLKEKGVIDIHLKKNNQNKIEEYIDLDPFYNKLFLLMIDEKEEIDTNIYSTFEKELGRTLSPIEYELINGWIECGYKEDVILAALKEAVFNGVNSFRYIDRILFEWNKKGIDSIEKIERNKKEYIKAKEDVAIEVPDYDWLNEEE